LLNAYHLLYCSQSLEKATCAQLHIIMHRTIGLYWTNGLSQWQF